MHRLIAREAPDWDRLCRAAFVPLANHGRLPIDAAAEVLLLGDSRVTFMRSAPVTVDRSTALVAHEPRDDVLITIVTKGSAAVSAGAAISAVGAWSAVVCLSDQPYRLACGAASTITLRLPRPLLEVSDRELGRVHALVMDPGVAEIATLSQLLVRTQDRPRSAPRQQGSLERAAAALLSSLVIDRGPRDARRPDDQLFLQLCRSLERKATDPGLSIDAIARAHGISRRKMEQVFSRHGSTPAGQRRRIQLNQARTLLDHDEGSMSVADLSHAVGFGDTTAFIRAFRREFGTTPGAWRSRRPATARPGE